MDQNDLAYALGVTQALVWKWEADKGFPSGKNYAKLAHIAADPDDRAYFMEKAIGEAMFLSDVIKVMGADEQRNLCHRLGIDETVVQKAWDARKERRKVSGGARAPATSAGRKLVITEGGKN